MLISNQIVQYGYSLDMLKATLVSPFSDIDTMSYSTSARGEAV